MYTLFFSGVLSTDSEKQQLSSGGYAYTTSCLVKGMCETNEYYTWQMNNEKHMTVLYMRLNDLSTRNNLTNEFRIPFFQIERSPVASPKSEPFGREGSLLFWKLKYHGNHLPFFASCSSLRVRKLLEVRREQLRGMSSRLLSTSVGSDVLLAMPIQHHHWLRGGQLTHRVQTWVNTVDLECLHSGIFLQVTNVHSMLRTDSASSNLPIFPENTQLE